MATCRRVQWSTRSALQLWRQIKSGKTKPQYVKDIGWVGGWMLVGTRTATVTRPCIHVQDFADLLPGVERPRAIAYFISQGKL